MDNPQPTRRLKLHRSTWVVGLFTLVVQGLVIFPGQTIGGGSGGCGDLAGDREWVSTDVIEHGWPRTFLYRTALVEEGLGDWQNPPVPWLSTNAWFDLREQCYVDFSVMNLLFNVVMLILIVTCVGWAWESRRRRRNRLFQVNLADLIVLTVLISFPLGWYVYHRNETQREETLLDEMYEEFDGTLDVELWDSVTLDWLSRLIGSERTPYFHFVEEIEFSPDDDSRVVTLEQAMPLLRRFRYLDSLSVSPRAQPGKPMLRPILELPSIRHLRLDLIWIEGQPLDLAMAKELVLFQQLSVLEIETGDPVKEETKRFIRDGLPDCVVSFSEGG